MKWNEEKKLENIKREKNQLPNCIIKCKSVTVELWEEDKVT